VRTRREFFFLASIGACSLALPSLAQPQGKVWRIGFLGSGSAAGYAKQVEALRAGLRELGYIEGKNVLIEFRWADSDYARLPELANELARLNVDVIVTHQTAGTKAAKNATKTIPIVMARGGDPVAQGLVASLARPGGNITGTVNFSQELSAKRLELLKEALPHTQRVAVLFDPDNPSVGLNVHAMERAAKSLKLGLPRFAVGGPDEFTSAFAEMAKQRVDAVALPEDVLLNTYEGAISDLAAKHRLPSIGRKEFGEAGGLIGYGPNALEMFRRAGYYVDRILKGAKPADLPIEQPTKFEVLVNLKTAKALGLTIPQPFLMRADRVIE
jgi:putative ABC transport system substrate-binding protein